MGDLEAAPRRLQLQGAMATYLRVTGDRGGLLEVGPCLAPMYSCVYARYSVYVHIYIYMHVYIYTHAYDLHCMQICLGICCMT